MIFHFRAQEVSLRLLEHMGKEKLLENLRRVGEIPDDAKLTETPYKYVDTGEEFFRKVFCLSLEEADFLELAWNWTTEEDEE